MREAREEAGVEVELDHLIGVYYLRSRKNGLRFMFAARITVGRADRRRRRRDRRGRLVRAGELPQPTTPTMPYGVRDAVAGERGLYRDIDARAL